MLPFVSIGDVNKALMLLDLELGVFRSASCGSGTDRRRPGVLYSSIFLRYIYYADPAQTIPLTSILINDTP